MVAPLIIAIGIGGALGLLLSTTTEKQLDTALRVSGDAEPCCDDCQQKGTRCDGPPSNPCGAAVPEKTYFDGQLKQGDLYRLVVSVDTRYANFIKSQAPVGPKSKEAFLAETLKQLALRLGFGPTLLVTHDPTDPHLWQLITRWSLHSNRVIGLPNVVPVSITIVDEPPSQTGADSLGAGLDNGLTDDELWAVRYALASDEDTKHLGGFASTFGSDFPITTALLKAKSQLSALRSYQSPLMAKSNGTNKDLSKLVNVLKKATTPLGPEITSAWDKFAGLVVKPSDEAELGKVVASLTKAFLTRKDRGVPDRPSPAALQLALATRRPQLSNVENDDEISKRLTAINVAAKRGNEDAKKAQAKMNDANRTLERQQWVEWYKRQAAVRANSDASAGGVTGAWASRSQVAQRQKDSASRTRGRTASKPVAHPTRRV